MIKQDIYNAPGYAGIYCIINKIDNKAYIGQATKLQKKLKEHWRIANSEEVPDVPLYNAIKEHGLENFEVKILKTFHDALGWRTQLQLNDLEKKYIEEYDSINNGYNTALPDCI